MSKQSWYLGRVAQRSGTQTQTSFAFLAVLCEIPADQSAWQEIQNPEQSFPNRGLVSWYNPPLNADYNTLWQFQLEERLSFDATNPRFDKFQIANPPPAVPAREVINLRNYAVDQIRQMTTETGLELPFILGDTTYLWISDQQWIGPVTLDRSSTTGRWLLAQYDQPLPIYPASSAQVTELRIDSHSRYLLAPTYRSGTPLGQIDWAVDATVLKRILKRLKALDAEYTATLSLTDKAITRLADKLATGGLLDGNALLEEQRLRRARTIIRTLDRDQAGMAVFNAELLELPSVLAQIQFAREQARAAAIAEVQQALAAKLNEIEAAEVRKAQLAREIADQEHVKAARQAQLTIELTAEQQRLDAMVVAQQAQFTVEQRRLEAVTAARQAQLRAELTAEQQRLDAVVADFETNLAERVKVIMDRPTTFLSEIAVLRAVLTPSAAPLDRATVPPRSPGPLADAGAVVVPSRWEIGALTAVSDEAQLRKRIRDAFRARQLPPRAARLIHAACLAQTVPIVAGDGALAALETYTNCVAGGRLLWLPVTPTMLEPADLLGRADPSSRRFIPQSGGLIDVLREAQTSEDLYVVVLDGINRAAIDSYLTPLLACYISPWAAGSPRKLPLFHPANVAPEDPYATIPWLTWSSNVLLAATLADGPASLAPPGSLWGSAILIHLDSMHRSEEDSAAPTLPLPALPSYSAVGCELWRAWQEPRSTYPFPDWGDLIATLADESVFIARSVQTVGQRLFSALNTDSSDVARALMATITHCLVPAAITAHQYEETMRVLTSRLKDTDQLVTAGRLVNQVLL